MNKGGKVGSLGGENKEFVFNCSLTNCHVILFHWKIARMDGQLVEYKPI